jgi:hypothetical protein
MNLNAAPVVREPLFAGSVEIVTWAVVDNQKYLPALVLPGQLLQEKQEALCVEDLCKAICEASVVESDSAKDMRRLSLTVCVDSRLMTYTRPGSMERSVDPEAGFVAEQDNATTRGSFFLMAGKVVRIQTACRSASARASLFRGRCTEKPSW